MMFLLLLNHRLLHLLIFPTSAENLGRSVSALTIFRTEGKSMMSLPYLMA